MYKKSFLFTFCIFALLPFFFQFNLADSNPFKIVYHWFYQSTDKLSAHFCVIYLIYLAYGYSIVSRYETFSVALNVLAGIGVVFFSHAVLETKFLPYLLIFWEISCLCSSSLIRNKSAFLHYLCVHSFGGFLLLLCLGSNQLIENNFVLICILTSVLINCGCFPFSFWVVSGYSNSRPHTHIILQLITTKFSLYTLNLIGFEGLPLMIFGGLTAVYGLIYMLFESSIRRVLCYNTVSQCGIGIAIIGSGIDATFFLLSSCVYQSIIFFITSNVLFLENKRDVSGKFSLNKYSFISLFTVFVAVASMLGLPFTQGYAVKKYLSECGFNSLISNIGLLASCLLCTRFILFLRHKLSLIKFQNLKLEMLLCPLFLCVFCLYNPLNIISGQFEVDPKMIIYILAPLFLTSMLWSLCRVVPNINCKKFDIAYIFVCFFKYMLDAIISIRILDIKNWFSMIRLKSFVSRVKSYMLYMDNPYFSIPAIFFTFCSMFILLVFSV